MDFNSVLKERDWRRVTQAIQSGSCVLLLGPYAAVDPEGTKRTPLNVVLARELVGELDGHATVDETDLAHVAQLFEGIEDRNALNSIVEEFYQRYKGKTTELHNNLATLPFSLCISTTPDRYLYNAFDAAHGKSPTHAFYDFRQSRPLSVHSVSAHQPLIYSLFGDLEDPYSLVLTENDLLTFLVNVIKGAPAIPPLITSYFADPDTSFLFLGFGFELWHVRILLHLLRDQTPRNRSLALENIRFFDHPDHQQVAVFFKESQKIDFSSMSWDSFTQELRERSEKSQISEPTRHSPPEDAPTVFLCHSSEDGDDVSAIGERLNDEGIQTWRDRQNLRGGDNWDRLIKRVIQKQADYVAVLQTPNMMRKIKSYFHLEIDEAMQQQRFFGDEFAFVLPTFLKDCNGFEKLAHLHSTDLTVSGGFEALVAAIKEDWKKRKEHSS